MSSSGRTPYSVPSSALRRAGLPSCASQPKSDGDQLPCGGPLPEHGATTLNSLASKQTVLRRFRFPKVFTLSSFPFMFSIWYVYARDASYWGPGINMRTPCDYFNTTSRRVSTLHLRVAKNEVHPEGFPLATYE